MKTHLFALTFLVPSMVLFAMTSNSLAKPTPTEKDKKLAELEESLAELFANHRGKISAAFKHLENGQTLEFEADRPMPTASLIKLPLMIASYQAANEGKVDLDEMITLKEEDKVPGSGVLTNNFSAGLKLSLYDAVRLMIAYSDNTATNLVADAVGLTATRDLMHKLDCPETQLHSKVYRRDTSIDPERSQQFGLGSTTAAEMISLLERLYADELVDADSCKAMREHLYACDDTSKIPRYLPAEAKVAHKTGAVSATRCDAGVIESPAGPIAFCFLSTENEDNSWSNENEAELVGAEFGRMIYGYFNDTAQLKATPVARVLTIGASGDLVESLQRTLNARTKEPLGIGVDGDFGPNTERAVMKFQQQEGLEPSGKVDVATWRALGTLITEDGPGPTPDEINGAPLETSPADPLEGPPLVTCAAYAIADAETGELLFTKNENEVRDPASITKTMTALLVAELAEKDPSILEETITFTSTADDTPGSTAGVRVGERLSVEETLYGLMLPSGNDAARMLAEYFGERLAPDGSSDLAPAEKFIAAMNARAKELGMENTGYKNPHGLTAKGHVTTAADMIKLGRAAMRLPVLREIVTTRRHVCTLSSVDGYTRNVLWKNSNQLLGIEGFTGIKTGTTTPAGACLVSTGERDGKKLVMVTLGSTSGTARYVDARNLYRWAWSELGAE